MLSSADRESGARVFEFGPFRLDAAERRLLRGDEHISLTPKAFDTLLLLVQNHGRLVRKDDLIKLVWPDAIVEEANLARNVWTLRRALGEREGSHTYIETIPKVGYRFIATVTQLPVVADGIAGTDQRGPAAADTSTHGPAMTAAAPLLARLHVPTWAVVMAALTATAVVAVWLWRERGTTPTVEPGVRMLTDGTYDDVGASWGPDGRIYFSRAVTEARIETWTMDSNGATQRRANSEIKTLLTGRWSADGKKVIFVKEADPKIAYLADADGSHEITLPFVPGNLDWSADGSRFVYQFRASSSASGVALYNLGTGQSTTVTSHPAGDADPSFSPDGTRIAFTSWRDGNAEVYVIRLDGTEVRRITNHPAFDNYPVFSPDGTHLAFQSNREDEHVEIYLQALDVDAPPIRLTRSNTLTGFAPKCWSADGTELLVYTNRESKSQVGVIAVNPYPARQLLGDAEADLSFPRLSADSRRLLYEARLPDRSLELRVTDLSTNVTARIFRTEPGYPADAHLSPAWSPDNARIAFSARVDGNSEILLVGADGTGLRNLTRNRLLDSSPVFLADGREIVFARDAFGQAQLYRMDLTGGGQRRVTNAAGYEMSPAASPTGGRLAFSGDRESRGLDILLLDLTAPERETVVTARRFHDTLPAFSRDGSHLVFVAGSDGNPEIYRVKVDGTGLVRVTYSKSVETAPHFAGDHQHLLFSSDRAGKSAIYQVEVR